MLEFLIAKLFHDGTLEAVSNGVDVKIKAKVFGAKVTLTQMPLKAFAAMEIELAQAQAQAAPEPAEKPVEQLEAKAAAPAARTPFRVIDGGVCGV